MSNRSTALQAPQIFQSVDYICKESIKERDSGRKGWNAEKPKIKFSHVFSFIATNLLLKISNSNKFKLLDFM